MGLFGQRSELLRAQHALERFGGCFHCRERRLIEGPSGGICTNVECANCGTRMNVASFPDGPVVIEVQETSLAIRAAYDARRAARDSRRWSRRFSVVIRKLVRPEATIPHA